MDNMQAVNTKCYARIYEVSLGAFIQIDRNWVKRESCYRDGDKMFFNGEQIFGDLNLETEYRW